jgi:hypothetical protein
VDSRIVDSYAGRVLSGASHMDDDLTAPCPLLAESLPSIRFPVNCLECLGNLAHGDVAHNVQRTTTAH